MIAFQCIHLYLTVKEVRVADTLLSINRISASVVTPIEAKSGIR